MHDLIVAGGGPAGLAVALGAARTGLDVVVCEKRAGVLDKACGEGLMPGALRELQALGLDPPGHPIVGITYRQGDTSVHAPFRRGSGRGVRRLVLHDALREAVAGHGVPIVDAAVGTVEQSGGHVRAAGLEARYLVAADGLHSPIRAALGLQRTSSAPPRWGLRRHFAVAPRSDAVEVTWARDREAYVTPVDEQTIGVAVLSSERGGFDDQLQSFPHLVELLRGASPVSDVRGAGPLSQPVGARSAGRVLLVGDAAGYIDALTGEGLALALAAAAQAVRCIVDDAPHRYDRDYARVSRRSRWLTSGLLWARHRRSLAPRVVPLAARAPWLFGAAVNQLAR